MMSGKITHDWQSKAGKSVARRWFVECSGGARFTFNSAVYRLLGKGQISCQLRSCLDCQIRIGAEFVQ